MEIKNLLFNFQIKNIFSVPYIYVPDLVDALKFYIFTYFGNQTQKNKTVNLIQETKSYLCEVIDKFTK